MTKINDIGIHAHDPFLRATTSSMRDLPRTQFSRIRSTGKCKDVLKKARVEWVGWHGFRRGLASNLNRLGVDDSVIQAILRHSDVSVTQRCYIKTVPPDAVVAMRRLSASVAELNKR